MVYLLLVIVLGLSYASFSNIVTIFRPVEYEKALYGRTAIFITFDLIAILNLVLTDGQRMDLITNYIDFSILVSLAVLVAFLIHSLLKSSHKFYLNRQKELSNDKGGIN